MSASGSIRRESEAAGEHGQGDQSCGLVHGGEERVDNDQSAATLYQSEPDHMCRNATLLILTAEHLFLYVYNML